ncbi:hypothetical protein BD769DRAFT_1460500, partial [Suillus cothurnatus]
MEAAASRKISSMCFTATSSRWHRHQITTSLLEVASRESHDFRGSFAPLLVRCITHPKEVLCFTCLGHQDSKQLEQCPGCHFWCCIKDKSSCTGRPIGIESHPSLWGHNNDIVELKIAYFFTHERAHPRKSESCLECEIPGWKSCSNKPFCWSYRVCPECASSGMMCLCERVLQTSSSNVRTVTGHFALLAPTLINAGNVTM